MSASKAPSRRKSCLACAKAKRRCEAQTPHCPRCLAKGLDCIYANDPLRSQPLKFAENEPEVGLVSTGYQDQFLPEFDPSSSFEGAGELLPFDVFDQWLDTNSLPLGLTPIPQPAVPVRTALSKRTVELLVRDIKSYPAMLVRHGQTPFIHARLYEEELPNVIQDAYGICASYMAKTEENSHMIFRIIEAKSHKLVQQDPLSCTLLDHIAYVQALLTIHIIQLFDGDIRQRAVAETHDAILGQWTQQLQQRIQYAEPAQNWRAWIFAESIRRIIIFSFLFRAIYSVIKRGYCESLPIMASLPFTAQPLLWNSVSGHTWQGAAQILGSSMVSYLDFTQMWERGQVVEVEAFQKLLLTACKGEVVDEAVYPISEV